MLSCDFLTCFGMVSWVLEMALLLGRGSYCKRIAETEGEKRVEFEVFWDGRRMPA